MHASYKKKTKHVKQATSSYSLDTCAVVYAYTVDPGDRIGNRAPEDNTLSKLFLKGILLIFFEILRMHYDFICVAIC